MNQVCYPFRRYLLNNVKNDSDLPRAFRWLYKDYAPWAITTLEPICRKIAVYHLLPFSEKAKVCGVYNWILREESLLISPWEFEQEGDHGEAFSLYEPSWLTDVLDPPTVEFTAPVFWEKDLKGSKLTLNDGPNLRWLIVFHYPEGVLQEKGEEWFLKKLAPEIAEYSGVKRFITSRTLKKNNERWDRVAEIWFDSYEDWENLLENIHAKPDWSQLEQFPYFKPYQNFVSAFMVDRPDCDLLTQYRGYIASR